MNFVEQGIPVDEVDTSRCLECGLTADEHQRVDTPDGPEYYCDEAEVNAYRSRQAIVARMEMADPRDRWKHTGEPRPADSSEEYGAFYDADMPPVAAEG